MGVFPTENIILLEFLVDEVNFEQNVQKDLQVMRGETCIAFQFLDNTSLLVCEQDLSKKKDPCAKSNVKNGKSCLFSLTPCQTENATKEFNIGVEVFKKMRPGTLPERVPIGKATISVANLFKELMECAVKGCEKTCVKTLKNIYKIFNPTNEPVGKVGVFIRMSCFGKLIVTQFQMNLESKAVEFKAKEGHYLFKYNKKDGRCPTDSKQPCSTLSQCDIPSGNTNDRCLPPRCGFTMQDDNSTECAPECTPCPSPCPPPVCPPPFSCSSPCPASPCPDSPCTPQPCPSYPCPYPQCNACPSQPCCSPCNPYAPCCAPPPCCTPCGQCANCVPCSPCSPCFSPCCASPPCNPCFPCTPCSPCSPCAPCSPCSPCRPCSPPPCCAPPCKPPTPCPSTSPVTAGGLPPPCAYPYDDQFQEIGASMGPNSLTIRVHKDMGKLETVNDDADDECECKPGEIGKKKNKKNKCPNKGKKNKPVTNGPCCVPSPCIQPCTCVPKVDDPTKEVFVLRIGKKNDGSCNQKRNLELELSTPKGKEIKPPAQKVSSDSQYDSRDFPPNYLEDFYGKDRWNKMQEKQLAEQKQIAAIYGDYGIGLEPKLASDEEKDKSGKGKGKDKDKGKGKKGKVTTIDETGSKPDASTADKSGSKAGRNAKNVKVRGKPENSEGTTAEGAPKRKGLGGSIMSCKHKPCKPCNIFEQCKSYTSGYTTTECCV